MNKLVVAVALAACGDDGGTATTDELTLETCTYTIALEVPDPYAARFKCVDIAVDGTDFVFTTTGLPPHSNSRSGSSRAWRALIGLIGCGSKVAQAFGNRAALVDSLAIA